MAGRLKLRPLCVYGTDEIPQGAMSSYAIDRCIAKAVFTAALYAETPPLYVDANHVQCCPAKRSGWDSMNLTLNGSTL